MEDLGTQGEQGPSTLTALFLYPPTPPCMKAISMASARLLFGAAAATLLCLPSQAQVSWGGLPPSTYDANLSDIAPTVQMAKVDVERLLFEDAARGKAGAFRFGDELPVSLSPSDSGVWSAAENGDLVWRLRIESPGAHSLSLIFDQFELTPGAELFAYNDDRSTVYGMYNHLNNQPNGQFAFQPLPGGALTLELVEPASATPSLLRVGTVVHDYRDIYQVLEKGSVLPKAAGACNNDVNCPEGGPWDDQIRSVAAIFIGGGLCSGSMINNTANDGTQYFITANHCGGMNNAVFRFNYEFSGCGSGTAPTNQTVQGSTLMKASSAGDYRLIRLNQQIPANYNVFFEGWDRSNVTPTNTIAIHHPQVGPKKISFDNDPPQKSGIDWQIVQWDDGVTEPGSSGSPLYSNEGLFIGALYGGQATCSFPFNDYYPRFGNNFSALAPWLDPLGTGQLKLPGINAGGTTPPTCGVTKIGVAAGGSNIASLDAIGTPDLGAVINVIPSGFNSDTTGLVILSAQTASTPLVGGLVYVDHLNPAASLPFTLSGGATSVNVQIPSNPALALFTGYAQAAAPDPSQSFGWALSNGLAITFCP